MAAAPRVRQWPPVLHQGGALEPASRTSAAVRTHPAIPAMAAASASDHRHPVSAPPVGAAVAPWVQALALRAQALPLSVRALALWARPALECSPAASSEAAPAFRHGVGHPLRPSVAEALAPAPFVRASRAVRNGLQAVRAFGCQTASAAEAGLSLPRLFQLVPDAFVTSVVPGRLWRAHSAQQLLCRQEQPFPDPLSREAVVQATVSTREQPAASELAV